MCAQLSAIDVTAKTFFESLYLVLEMRKIVPWIVSMHPQHRPFTVQLFLDFYAISFPRWPLIFFGQHDSPSNLAESRYPRHEPRSRAFYYSINSLLHTWNSYYTQPPMKVPITLQRLESCYYAPPTIVISLGSFSEPLPLQVRIQKSMHSMFQGLDTPGNSISRRWTHDGPRENSHPAPRYSS